MPGTLNLVELVEETTHCESLAVTKVMRNLFPSFTFSAKGGAPRTGAP
jgi:hypothetical protein